ncbi:DUF6002 family protein [Amycolatopsis benzoatilytica]|uniref:DUF6002 family protein n=1 Tax=Amycolatopsis benzoatilytica TaxID=346045 RepID=UPI000368D0C8|nr:DUF6002 family protein [Amycolatopsis benzoatilytica]
MPVPRASRNLITAYYDRIRAEIGRRAPAPATAPGRFAPGSALPGLDRAAREYFSVATAAWGPLAEVDGHSIRLLDLTGNPGTHTTKTFASLLIVARAVEHIRRTGEPIVLFTPTSANKGVALRDAVDRAIATGLVRPDQLRAIVLAPARSRSKFRSSALSREPELARRNPVLLLDGARPEQVKDLAREFAAREEIRPGAPRLWFTLDLDNYLVADAARAFLEHDVDPARGGRWHAHAVSSAFGLLGYHQGREQLEAAGEADPAAHPGFLLVQHLGAPDMVLSLLHGDHDPANAPRYRRSAEYYVQDTDPHFPLSAQDPDEVLEPTFYTRRPATSATMDPLVRRFGGTGIVVSRQECTSRYAMIRDLLTAAGRPMPAEHSDLREWSLVMAMTGILNAIERRLVPAGTEIVLHASGTYSAADYRPIEPSALVPVTGLAQVSAAVDAALAVPAGR